MSQVVVTGDSVQNCSTDVDKASPELAGTARESEHGCIQVTKKDPTKLVVVAGDLVWDYNVIQHDSIHPNHWRDTRNAALAKCPGGAWYTRDVLTLAYPEATTSVEIIGCLNDEKYCADTDPPKDSETKDYAVADAYHLCSPHEKVAASGEHKHIGSGKVWRIAKSLGLCRPNCDRNSTGRLTDNAVPFSQRTARPTDMLVLDDHDIVFRGNKKLWPEELTGSGSRLKNIVLKTYRNPCKNSELWTALRDGHADRLTVVLTADTLRERGASISLARSWDETIEDVVREFETGSSARDLALCRRVVVAFGYEGVATFSRCSLVPRKDSKQFPELCPRLHFERFIYHPDELENVSRGRWPGHVRGGLTILTAAVVRHELDPEGYPLVMALRRGLAALRYNLETGAGTAKDKFKIDASSEGIRHLLCDPLETFNGATHSPLHFCSAFPHDILSDGPMKTQPPTVSNLLQDLVGPGLEYMNERAVDVVRRGPDRALREAPKARYGKYLTVDREEIERINSLRALIQTYRNATDDSKPLSIAVFGPPGSGKSFAIKQLAEDLFGKKIKEATLEFNLSQMKLGDESDLYTAFHQIRDASLLGQIPLVFWDEFDTGELAWLKYFLAPMQDAQFQARSIKHPFGKAIFVFAGGTSENFERFDNSDAPDKKTREDFVNKKGPDFVSRLRGYVNIKGPNPIGKNCACQGDNNEEDRDHFAEDPTALIRRAIVLRGELERSCKQLLDPETHELRISPGVLRAFLRVKKYLFGARSLTALVSMCSAAGVSTLGPSELPAPELLRMHASPDFIEHVFEGELEPDLIEDLAKSCHESWLKVKPQSELPEWLRTEYSCLQDEGKEENRRSARLVRAKLADVGYGIVRATKAKPESDALFEVERERLLKAEHDIWLRSRLLNGWEWAEKLDVSLRLHPDVRPFDAVSPEHQQYDEAIISRIAEILQSYQYEIVKVRPAGRPENEVPRASGRG